MYSSLTLKITTMKNFFQFIWNLIIFVYFTFCTLLMFFWYGKLPKISMYHYWNMPSTFNELYNDTTIQSRFFPDEKETNRLNKQTIEFIQERINLYEKMMNPLEESTDTFRSYFARVNELKFVLDSVKDK